MIRITCILVFSLKSVKFPVSDVMTSSFPYSFHFGFRSSNTEREKRNQELSWRFLPHFRYDLRNPNFPQPRIPLFFFVYLIALSQRNSPSNPSCHATLVRSNLPLERGNPRFLPKLSIPSIEFLQWLQNLMCLIPEALSATLALEPLPVCEKDPFFICFLGFF